MAPLLTDEAQRWFKQSPELQTQQQTSLARMANFFDQRELSRKFQAAAIRIGQEHGQVSNQNLGYW